MSPSRGPAVAFAVLAVLLTLVAGPTSATADPTPPPTPPPTQPPTLPDRASDAAREHAEQALARVETLVTRRTSSGPRDRADLTLALRDLAIQQRSLDRADHRRARALLARPSDDRCVSFCFDGDERRRCSAVLCVHWVPARLDPMNAPPGRHYVRAVLRTMTKVHNKYVDAGYRRPLGDHGRGGNNKPDIYLAQIGHSYYGYCESDDPNAPRHGGTWGYCVLDNDYSPREFPAHTPLDNMRVTAAHEYFHNVQFAHDIGEDGWFMEATATWAEDEVFDGINDNAYYLPEGPIGCRSQSQWCWGHPWKYSLDTYGGLYHYGTWIFFRYLTDRYGVDQGDMDQLVLRMWKLATGPDRERYSMAAIKQVLAQEGTTLLAEFTGFSAGNRSPSTTYAEEYDEVADDPDADARYPTAALTGRADLGAGDTIQFTPPTRHLSARHYRFAPDGPLTTSLHLTFDFGVVADAPLDGAALVRWKHDGAIEERYVDATDPTVDVPFTKATTWVEVTLTNALTDYVCWRGLQWSCGGHAVDDKVTQQVTARVT